MAARLDWPPTVSDPATCLGPTDVIESTAPQVIALATRLTGDLSDPFLKARACFDHVRDEVAYNLTPLLPSRDCWQATATLDRGKGFCEQKAVVLTALLRASGVPAAMAFQHICDHQLLGTRFEKALPGGVIICHGLVRIHLDGAWWDADPTLDTRLCEHRGYRVTRLRRGQHARLPATTTSGEKHFDILAEFGPFQDLPHTVTDLAVGLMPMWEHLQTL